MAEQYFLYTVTGLREPFYAAVDHETGRAWTAPTKDGAIRQARDEGIEDFVEKTITREKFLRSLGIDTEPRPHPPRDSVPPQQPAPQPPRSGLGSSWFVVGENAVDDDSNGKAISIPPWSKSNKKARPARGGSPFAALPIPAPSEEVNADSGDFLIIPSDHSTPAAPTPFTDAPPAIDLDKPDE